MLYMQEKTLIVFLKSANIDVIYYFLIWIIQKESFVELFEIDLTYLDIFLIQELDLFLQLNQKLPL